MEQPEAPASEDYEYEYEYDDVEVETFFVDIDLSSLNPEIKANHSPVSKSIIPAKRKAHDSTNQNASSDRLGLNPAGSAAKEARATPTPTQEQQDTPPRIAYSDQDVLLPFSSRVQILDLDSVNPIVSYQGQVYSCTWSDMVGTNMFFTQPEMMKEAEALKSTDDYDLIGMSRIKLVGHRAKLAEKLTTATEAEADGASTQVDGGDHVERQDSVNQTREKQASFLEKIKEIKRRREATYVARTDLDETAPANQERKL